MSYKRRHTLSYDPVSKKTKVWHELDRGQEWAVETKVDVTALIDSNKAEYAMTDEHARWGKPGEVWAKVASIDPTVYFELIRQGIIDRDDDASLLRWIQNRDNLAWRTRPGNLI